MSKRKTPEKHVSSGPKAKRAKLNTHTDCPPSTNNAPTTTADISAAHKHVVLHAHCYDTNKTFSTVEITRHASSSSSSRPPAHACLDWLDSDALCSRIGQKLKIYWNDDKQWYYGTITDYQTSTQHSLVTYQDGESEWLNLTRAAASDESVEFLVDAATATEMATKPCTAAGDGIHTGTVASTFNHGCVTQFVSTAATDGAPTNASWIGVAFDASFVEHLRKRGFIDGNPFIAAPKTSSSSSMQILKLLHLCRFDEQQQQQTRDCNPGHCTQQIEKTQKQKLRRSPRHQAKQAHAQSNTNGVDRSDRSSYAAESEINCETEDATPWHRIGCAPHMDAITSSQEASHIRLIHSLNHRSGKNSKQKSDSSVQNNDDNDKKKKQGGSKSKTRMRKNQRTPKTSSLPSSSHVPATAGATSTASSGLTADMNSATKKCNTKGILELKAVYPLDLIRAQNHAERRKVVVIGAGISGLACARELMCHGYDVTVLEARGRAGGRICTDYSLGVDGDHGCDLGGGWIHGVKRNPMTRLVERLKLTLHSTSGDIDMYGADGKRVDHALDAKVEKEFNAVLDRLSTEKLSVKNNTNGGLGVGVRKHGNTTSSSSSLGDALTSYLEDKRPRVSDAEHNLWNWHFSNLEYSNATDLQRLSLTEWDQDDEYGFAGDHCLIQEGYGRIIEALQANVDITYNACVTSVDWSDDRIKVGAKIQLQNSENDDEEETQNVEDDGAEETQNNEEAEVCSENIYDFYAHVKNNDDDDDDDDDNKMRFIKVTDPKVKNQIQTTQTQLHAQSNSKSTQNQKTQTKISNSADSEFQTLEADAVVVTVPLGVLKQGDIAFTPALPSWKQRAIEHMGFGLLNKVFLRFESVFWDIESDYIGYASSVHGEFYLFVNLAPVTGTPVLMSLVSGSFAERLETQSDDEIVAYALQVLRGIFEKTTTTTKTKMSECVDARITRWKQDPFARGSYSYIAKGCSGDVYDRLSYSVKDKLYFAGEATVQKWPASVHGAYLSGIREARKILNLHYIHHSQPDCKTNGNTNEDCNTTSAASAWKKAGLSQCPIRSIFQPVKDKLLRTSARKFAQKCTKNGGGSNTTGTGGSNTTCALCGGEGFMASDDVRYVSEMNAIYGARQKLIGPFVVDRDAAAGDNENGDDKFYIHYGCGVWSPDIHTQDNQWYNVVSCVKRSKHIKCCHCRRNGASVHCHNKHCLASYHVECAQNTQCWDFDRFDEGQLFFCRQHRNDMLTLYLKTHETKVVSVEHHKQNTLRTPRPPAIY